MGEEAGAEDDDRLQMTVKRNVCHSAPRKMGLESSALKFARPTHFPVNDPAVASVKLR